MSNQFLSLFGRFFNAQIYAHVYSVTVDCRAELNGVVNWIKVLSEVTTEDVHEVVTPVHKVFNKSDTESIKT